MKHRERLALARIDDIRVSQRNKGGPAAHVNVPILAINNKPPDNPAARACKTINYLAYSCRQKTITTIVPSQCVLELTSRVVNDFFQSSILCYFGLIGADNIQSDKTIIPARIGPFMN